TSSMSTSCQPPCWPLRGWLRFLTLGPLGFGGFSLTAVFVDCFAIVYHPSERDICIAAAGGWFLIGRLVGRRPGRRGGGAGHRPAALAALAVLPAAVEELHVLDDQLVLGPLLARVLIVPLVQFEPAFHINLPA